MNVAPPPLPTCSICQTVLDPNDTCPRCRAPEDWNDQIEALDFVVRRLRDWHQAGDLTDRQLQALTDSYDKRRQEMHSAANSQQMFQAESGFPPRDHCWSCGDYLYTSSSHCTECGAPITHPGAKSLRFWRFLTHEIERHEESGWITLRQAHELLADTNARMDALQRKLERERAVPVIPVLDDAPAAPPRPRRRRRDEEPIEVEPTRTFMEVLLDPHMIQWLLAAGGALIVLGGIIWLASLELFQNAAFVAVALGLGNAVLLAGGWALILATRFQNAGRALTLLACMVMPLNLWFYHTHDLVTLDNHLWVAALVCCIIYTASALVLRDSLFVYVLVGGVTLTGLLILAQVHHFGEVFAPTLLLMILGLICLHAERAFPPGDGPFARQRFGMAFYWSAQPLFACGLLLLLGAQMIGWLHEPLFRHLGMREPPDVAKHDMLPYTLLIVLAGMYAFIYADLVVRRIGVYLYFAAVALLWAEVQLLVLLAPAEMEAVVIITLSLTALVINVVQATLSGQQRVLRTLAPLGVLLSIAPVLLGVLLHFRATNIVLHDHLHWPFQITWLLVGAMAITAASCRAGAFLYRHSFHEISVVYFFATAAATLIGAAELTWMLGLQAWELETPLVMVIPILYLIAAHLYKGRSPENPLVWAAHASTVVMIICSLWAAVVPQVVPGVQGRAHHLLLALFCVEATIFYGLAGGLRRSQVSLYLGAVMFCGALWQLLISFDLPNEFYVVAFASVGLSLLIVYRLGIFENFELPTVERAGFQSANAMTTLGYVSGALLALNRALMSQEAVLQVIRVPLDPDWRSRVWTMLVILIFLAVVSLVSALIVRHPVWRRVHLVFLVINGVLIALMIHTLSTLSPWQRLEIISIAVGGILLVVAYVGWWRETEEKTNDLVSIAFVFGSLMLAGPLLLSSAIHRFGFDVSVIDELGLVAAALALFISGVACRIKITTLVGTIAMALYVLMVLIYLHRFLKETVIIGIYLTLGGALLFGIGLFLSLYRDWLLALPTRVRRREGLFRIFDWR